MFVIPQTLFCEKQIGDRKINLSLVCFSHFMTQVSENTRVNMKS